MAQNPDKYVRFLGWSILGHPVLVKIEHPKSEFVRFSDPYCIYNIYSLAAAVGTAETIYSKHPNTEPPSVFGFNLMPVPIIRISDHLKSGQINPDTSLDRFGMKKYLL
jgi:hypothetical protein